MKFVTNPKFHEEDIVQLNKNQMKNHFSVVVENTDNILLERYIIFRYLFGTLLRLNYRTVLNQLFSKLFLY